MQFALENLESEKILQQILHAAADQSPVGSGLINYFVDTVLFPEPKDNLWHQMEGRVEALVKARLDEVVTSIADNSATNLLLRLRSLGDQLKQFRYLTDPGERKLRIAFLVSQVESATAECAALPNAWLLTAARNSFTVSQLRDGRVLVVGGLAGATKSFESLDGQALDSCEIFVRQ